MGSLTPEPPRDPVGAHYDALDRWYRALWGEHLHHGIWWGNTRDGTQARDNLLRAVAQAARLKPGDRVCDVGCGYGGPARWLAAETGARLVGVTNSPAQATFARSAAVPGVEIQLADWRANGLPGGSFDAVLAIESLAHFADPAEAIREMARVAKPGGRLVIATWITRENPPAWANRWLFDPIRDVGESPGLTDARNYVEALKATGAREISLESFGRHVRRTWSQALLHAAQALTRDPALRADALRQPGRTARLAASAVRIWLAYRLGALDYAILTCER